MPSFRTESGGPRASPYSTVKSIKGNTKARGDKEGKSGKMAYVYDKKLILTLVLKVGTNYVHPKGISKLLKTPIRS